MILHNRRNYLKSNRFDRSKKHIIIVQENESLIRDFKEVKSPKMLLIGL